MQETTTLLYWYDRNFRNLPWRTAPNADLSGAKPNPYHVWLSEIMLQQTTVATVIDYFLKFTVQWPNLENLAEAEEEDVLKAWAGLGYYSRARNLHRCAKLVMREYNGRFPEEEHKLQALPGIGPYTSAAIAAIAFNQHAAVVDGNVERVISRLHAITDPLPGAKHVIKSHMGTLTPHDRPGDFAQAVMDLGATVCTPRSPACTICPWVDVCVGRKQGIHETLPRKAPKKVKPTRKGMAFIVRRADGATLLRRRPDKGLLAGMSEPPTSIWAEDMSQDDLSLAPFNLEWIRASTQVKHTFTHFHLELAIWFAEPNEALEIPEGYWWSTQEELDGEALPTVMKKAVRTPLA
ncbi:A/G-specific adenine glycosylase [Pseudovibrio exalbescens]|uniref:A/G-specific adenine glycosylase n=1 Tax=Pseudovibrio exalbescens TaxID=197461 RepID=UPI0023659D58|nr:A/G-specific adenine glycosylase [Pseudovibrio exalbescens]MDD7911264.1 A/G-specific adenine glycosylase [Pseudovibrio exalbescens]